MEVTADQMLQSIGEKQMRLDLMAAYASRIEAENAQLKATIEAQAEQITALQNPPEVPPPSEDEIASARQEAGE